MNRTRAYWLCQIAGWGLLFGLNIGTHPENWVPGEVQTTLLNWAFGVGLSVAVTHAFRLYAKRHGWARKSLSQLVPRALLAAVVLASVYIGIGRLVYYTFDLLRSVAHNRPYPPTILREAFGVVPAMAAWIIIYLGVHAFWNYRRAEIDRWKLQAQAETARLEALKLQLNPHFFFNSLASIRSLISEAPGRAKKMVGRLARLLRSTLQAKDQRTVPLQDELSTVQTYLQLENVRFEDRLDWHIDVDEAARQCRVPFMMVQTLVENAVKHGIAQQRDGGTVAIEATLRDRPEPDGPDTLRLRVSNPGRLDDGAARQGSGTGLDNARERLQLLFGDAAELALTQSGPETVAAVAEIPQQPGEEDVGVRSGGEEADAEEELIGRGHSDDIPEGRAPAEGTGTVQSRSSGADAQEESETSRRRRLLLGGPTYWLCQTLGWGGMEAGALVLALNRDVSWNEIVGDVMPVLAVFGVLGIGLTHGVRVYAKHQGWTDLAPAKLAPRVFLAAVVLGCTYVLLTAPWYLQSELPSELGAWIWSVLGTLVPPALSWSVLIGTWLALYFSVHAFWNRRQAEVDRWKLQARAETARLEALKLQLNPHFFFNSLASVRSLISVAPDRARTVVARLARLLRKTLQAGHQKTVPLEDELSMTETYLELEEVRFEDRLNWEINAGEDALHRQVPFMLVQTLVENAVKHGIGQRRDGGTITIDARVTDGPDDAEASRLRLQVINPGRLGDEDGADHGSGTGLTNARERLRLLFGADASLDLVQSGPDTVAATALIPRPSALEDRLAGAPPSADPPDALKEAALVGTKGG